MGDMGDMGDMGGVGDGHHGGGHRRRLPPPPDSGPGRVIIIASGVYEGFNTDMSKFTPELGNNRGFILKQNKDWLKTNVLDDLLSQLTHLGDGGNPGGKAFKPMKASGLYFCGAAVMMVVLFLGLGFLMNRSFDNGGEETMMIPVLGFGGVCCIGSGMFCMIGKMGSNMFSAASKMSKDRTGFCTLWSHQSSGLELRYVPGRTTPEYFELTEAYGAESASDSEESNALF